VAQFAFRILNVFAPSTFDGNPLCVFEDARGMTEQHMHLLTRQFNLSETAFVFPPQPDEQAAGVTARVRVFTPGHEMAFAGHPALGAAQVVRDVHATGPRLTLRFNAGDVPLSVSDTGDADTWSFAPPLAGAPRCWAPALAPAAFAEMLGLSREDLASDPMWVNTGSDHLLVPLRDAAAVARVTFDPARLANWPVSSLGRRSVYAFALGADEGTHLRVDARYLFIREGTVVEDPGTGSACANLGAWLSLMSKRANLAVQVTQGEQMGRLCCLTLDLDAQGGIRVGGHVIEIGRGRVEI